MVRKLPPEIWKFILRLATNAPDSLNTSFPDSLDYSSSVMDKPLPSHEYQKSMATKNCVIRVCRAWHELTISFLHEHIIIDRVERVPYIKEALDVSALENLESRVEYSLRRQNPSKITSLTPALRVGHPVGWFIRRLDIRFDHLHQGKYSRDPLPDIVSIIRRCSNIRTILVSLSEYNVDKSASLVLRNCSTTLRYFRFYSGMPHLSKLGFFVKFRDLEMLSLSTPNDQYGPSNYSHHLPSNLRANFCLPRLRTLQVSGTGGGRFLDDFAHAILPNLQRVVVTLPLTVTGEAFFIQHGSKVLCLDLQPGEYKSKLPAFVLTFCVTLQHLIATFDSCALDFKARLSHCIRRLSIRTPASCVTTTDINGLMAEIGLWVDFLIGDKTSSCPSVRLMNFKLDADFGSMVRSHAGGFVDWVRWVEVWTEWIKLLASKGIRFEDCCGDLIEVPTEFMEALRAIEEVAADMTHVEPE